MNIRKKLLKQYLNWFWLRPESAILLALRGAAYYDTLKFFDKNSLDVSCGDGVFSFIACGGEISQNYDMYQSLNLNGVRKGDFDTYDYFDNDYKVDITKKPDFVFEYGSDWKENLIKKSQKLNFYKNLLLHNNNKKLPFSDRQFNYIYSNATYWVEKFEFHINDLIRILNTKGYLVLEMKTTDIKKFSSFNYAKDMMGKNYCEIIDAGRLSTWRGLKTMEELKEVIDNQNQLKIIKKEPLYGDIMAYIWDIGLRPLFNPLVKLANNSSSEIRKEVKEEWCNIIFNLFAEFVENYSVKENECIEWIYVLQKN